MKAPLSNSISSRLLQCWTENHSLPSYPDCESEQSSWMHVKKKTTLILHSHLASSKIFLLIRIFQPLLGKIAELVTTLLKSVREIENATLWSRLIESTGPSAKALLHFSIADVPCLCCEALWAVTAASDICSLGHASTVRGDQVINWTAGTLRLE